jgi:hypothetical protein
MLRTFGAIIDTHYIKPQKANKQNKYKCPDCNYNLILKSGTKRIAHFSHKSKCSNNIQEQLKYMKSILDVGLTIHKHCSICSIYHKIIINTTNNIIHNSSILCYENNEIKYIIELGYIKHKNEWYKIDINRVDINNQYTYNYTCDDCKYGQVYFNQRGAGCGKTYESIQLLNKEVFNNKKIILFLTKTHSAKEVIYGELKEQYAANKLYNMSLISETLEKKYKLVFNRNDSELIILIGTIDSFTYTIYDKTDKIDEKDPYNDIIKKIHEGKIMQEINYANTQININCETLIIIDEAQDLGKNYMEAFITIVNKTQTDLYIIGDKLQSIWYTNNIYTCIEEADTDKITKSEGINKVMRFHNEQFKYFVNSLVPYHKYGLPKIEKICDRPCAYDHETIKPYTVFDLPSGYRTDIDDMDTIIAKIKGYMIKEIDKYNYKPNNFMFIFPILKKNTFAHILTLELNNFWCEKYNKRDKYVFLHKSEPGQIINLKESEQATRILSIHTSKGTGCEVVFVLGITEHALNIFSRQTDNIIYNSLLHVAVTRQKKAIYVGIENNNDDICRRFKGL